MDPMIQITILEPTRVDRQTFKISSTVYKKFHLISGLFHRQKNDISDYISDTAVTFAGRSSFYSTKLVDNVSVITCIIYDTALTAPENQ